MENIALLPHLILQNRYEIDESFLCSIIDFPSKHELVLIAQVHFRVIMKMSMIKQIRNIIEQLGVLDNFNIETHPSYYISSIVVSSKYVVFGDMLYSYDIKDLLSIRKIYNISRLDFDDYILNNPLSRCIALELKKIIDTGYTNFFTGFTGHRKHYSFNDISWNAEDTGHELIKALHKNHQLIGKEILNITLNEHSSSLFDLEETLNYWHGNSIQFFFDDDLALMDEIIIDEVILEIRQLLNEYGKTILFIFYFHPNTYRIQSRITTGNSNYEIVTFNLDDLSYTDACIFVKNEIFKYWIDEKTVIDFLVDDGRLYSRNELKRLMNSIQ